MSSSTSDNEVPDSLPYENGAIVAHHLIRKMSDTEFDRMLAILHEHQEQRMHAAEHSQR
ncbi:hypothetical protein ACWDA3_59115 [Nonomuraea rubra]